MTDIRAGSTQLTTHAARQEALLNTEVGEIFGVKSVYVTVREREVANALFEFGFSNAELAAHFYCSKRTIETHLKSLYAKTGTRHCRELVAWMHTHALVVNTKKSRDFLLPKAEKLFHDGLSHSEIAAKLGVSKTTVINYLKQLGLFKDIRRKIDTKTIVKLRNQGIEASAIARTLKISKQAVYYHLKKEKPDAAMSNHEDSIFG